jgi:glycosyltransferase involved in cell wall biosynthesis
MTLGVDVVIPTRDRDVLLPGLVAPLLKDPTVGRIIIVDDSSRPMSGGKHQIKALSNRIDVICTGGVGPAKAREAGARASQADVLLFLDDDVLPDQGLATLHVEHHSRASNLLVCGYTPVAPRPSRRLSAEAAVHAQTYEARCHQYRLDASAVLTHLWGGNFSLRRTDALRIGLASESFEQVFHEDRDFGLRCRGVGVRAVFDPTIHAQHVYEREWAAVAKESYCRGYSLVCLHQVHNSTLGPFDERQFEDGLPWPLRVLVRSYARSSHGRPAMEIIHALRWIGARLDVRSIQVLAVRLLRRMQAARGAREALGVSGLKRLRTPA